jgi:hypothetical protein
MAASTRSIVPVADATGFANVVSGMTTDGRPLSDSNPLFAWNATQKGLQYEGTSGTVQPLGPAMPFGHMGRTQGFQALTASDQLIIMAAGQVLLNGMTFDSATSSLVLPVTGYYALTIKGYASNGSAWNCGAKIRVNATTYTGVGTTFWKANANDAFSSATATKLFNAGDKLSVWCASVEGAASANTWGSSGFDGIYLEAGWVSGA